MSSLIILIYTKTIIKITYGVNYYTMSSFITLSANFKTLPLFEAKNGKCVPQARGGKKVAAGVFFSSASSDFL
ncbi:hypothetical protein KDA_08870 [Dictyobacter alpinus]|uniref:Uncharacterized protein n=1 Tax=Dictyobacter alpinus TaxID=2014873 RepID=A0A402B237_9CHLR|nr:hypothetical protein [Dictyobacter alpinus]GCE25403.1 hypothetical protein KDA_08870 [Dictyobacter alpinus]